MSRNNYEIDPVKNAETAVFIGANRIISDTQKMRTDPTEAIVSFEEHVKILALAALELIAYHTSPEQARRLIEDIASRAPGTSEAPATAV